MSKKRLVNRLLALGIATVSAVSVFAISACSPDSGGGGGATPLAAPTEVNIKDKKISWHGVEHADGYTVYEKQKTATGNPTEHTVTGATNCEYTIDDSLLVRGATYEYYVVATSTSDKYSDSPASSPKVEYTVPQMSKYEQLKNGGGNILVDEDFSTTTSIEKGGFDGSTKLYRNVNGSAEPDETKNTVKVESGHAVLVDESGDATELYVNFGHVTGVVEAYSEVKFSAPGGSWTPFQLYGSTNSKSNAEILGIRTTEEGSDKKVKLNYRLEGSNNNLGSANAIYINDKDTFGVYWKIDLTTGKVTVEVDGVALANELDVGAIGLLGLKLTSSNNGSKTFAEVDNIIVVGELYELADYIAAKKTQLEGKFSISALENDAVLGNISAGVQAKLTEQSALITGEDYDAVDTAYKAAVEAVEAVVVANAKTAACDIIDEYLPKAGGTYTGNQETALNNARASVKEKINAESVTSLEAVKAALAAGKLEIDEVENDQEANKKDVIVIIYGDYDEKIGQLLGTFTVKSEATKSLEDIIKLLEIPSGYYLEGLYKEKAYINKIETQYQAPQALSENITDIIYAKLVKVDKYQITFTGSANGCTSDYGYNTSGWTYSSAKKFSSPGVSIDGGTTYYANGVKLAGNALTFILSEDATVRIYFQSSVTNLTSKDVQYIGLKIDGTAKMYQDTDTIVKYTGADSIFYIDIQLAAGSHTLDRGGSSKEMSVFLMEITPD